MEKYYRVGDILYYCAGRLTRTDDIYVGVIIDTRYNLIDQTSEYNVLWYVKGVQHKWSPDVWTDASRMTRIGRIYPIKESDATSVLSVLT